MEKGTDAETINTIHHDGSDANAGISKNNTKDTEEVLNIPKSKVARSHLVPRKKARVVQEPGEHLDQNRTSIKSNHVTFVSDRDSNFEDEVRNICTRLKSVFKENKDISNMSIDSKKSRECLIDSILSHVESYKSKQKELEKSRDSHNGGVQNEDPIVNPLDCMEVTEENVIACLETKDMEEYIRLQQKYEMLGMHLSKEFGGTDFECLLENIFTSDRKEDGSVYMDGINIDSKIVETAKDIYRLKNYNNELLLCLKRSCSETLKTKEDRNLDFAGNLNGKGI